MPQPTNKNPTPVDPITGDTPSLPAPTLAVDLQPAPPSTIERPRRRRLRWLAPLILVIWLSLIGWLFADRQGLYDWWRLRGYQPPSAIAQLATQDTMDPYTRHLFYLNRPQLLPTVDSFRKNCPENPDTIVLGCYHPDQNGIYIYNVPDPTLAGVQQVTAAHEVLHAVYARLSPKARNNLDAELENYYQHGLTDPRVKAEVKLYQQTEPKDVMDEMSCTFGTEIAKLPAPLEAYYDQFFSNRAAIVGYEQQYEGAFTSRLATINTDDQQLTSLKNLISSQEAALNAKLAQITTDRNHLSSLLAAGQTSSYNSGVAGFNSEVNDYNAGVAELQGNVANYNQLVTARNLVAGQITTLDNALDTRLTKQTTR